MPETAGAGEDSGGVAVPRVAKRHPSQRVVVGGSRLRERRSHPGPGPGTGLSDRELSCRHTGGASRRTPPSTKTGSPGSSTWTAVLGKRCPHLPLWLPPTLREVHRRLGSRSP